MSIPESRIEAILSDILGYDVDLENPKSRVEELLVALGALVGNTPQLDNEGLIPISYLPPVAFNDCITVADQTARYTLTTDDVQNGDTVYQNDTQVMYFVVDDTKLDRSDGYKILAAGIAAQAVADKNGNDITTTYQTIIDALHKLSADLVDDSQSTNKFNMQADWSQSTSSAGDYIKNKPTLGTASALDVPVSGNASLTQVVKGDDSRLTDSRTPTAHNQTSDTINAMTGYAKAQADSAISTSDTLNAAIGKIEYKADVNKTNILSIVHENNENLELDNTSTYSNTYNGYFSAAGFVEDSKYISYSMGVTKNTTIYCTNKNTTYFSICVYNTSSLTNGTRYRFKSNSEDNLPYENNPLSLAKGQYIVFTTTVNDPAFAVTLTDYKTERILDDSINLNTSQIKQMQNNIDNCYIEYHNSDTGVYAEAVDIYVPAKVGYIRYHFAHGVSAEINANIWKIVAAYATDNQFTDRFALTTNGEWELAIQPTGAPDFAGGTAHGDQVMTDITWFIDGKQVTISNLTEKTKFTKISVVETSKLFNPSNPEIQMAQVTSEHIWNKEKLTINQALLWDTETEIPISFAYMGMHLPAKTATDHFYTDASYAPLACLGNYATYNNVKRAVVYGETSGVYTEFWNTEYPTGYTGENTFKLSDNNGGLYNKGYFIVISGTPNNTIPIGQTLWKSSVHYKFDVGK